MKDKQQGQSNLEKQSKLQEDGPNQSSLTKNQKKKIRKKEKKSLLKNQTADKIMTSKDEDS